MTREDIHEKIHFGDRLDYRSFNELHETIEEIFDYFEEEEEIIKNCNNCKFSTLFKYNNNYLKCKKGDISSRKININLDEIVSVLDKDFCCKKWESK